MSFGRCSVVQIRIWKKTKGALNMTDLYFHTRKGAALTSMLVVLFAWVQTASAEGISLNQCANGGIADAVDHMQCYEGWINGNLNQSKAAFSEGQIVPYRARLTGLTAGEEYTYTFSWDILKGGQHAIDYIGTYDYSVTDAEACDDALAPCPGTESTILIPPDSAAIPFAQIPGHLTLFGGTLDAVGPYLDISADVRGISVVFTPDRASAVLTWGGHISSPFDWGEGNTAANIKGSPYHTSNISLQNEAGQVVASGGKDVQLSASAVFRPSSIRVTKTSNKDGTFYFNSVQGSTPIPPDGESNPWTLIMDQFKDISAPREGSLTITESLLPAGPWRLKSITCTRMGDGTVFSYDADSDDPTDSAVFSVGEGETYSCTFANEFFGAPVLKVIKKVIAHDATCTTAIRDSSEYETRGIHSGEQVKYCFWVTNTGDDPALDISLSDDLGDELGVPADITLTGGSDLDGEADAPDLDVGTDWVYGELVVAIDVALNTKVTNVATALGTGQFDGQAYDDNDDANVIADKSSSCTLVASVYTGAGSCPGGPQVDVLAGTSVNWCAKATWDNNASMNLISINVGLLTTSESNSGANMAPGTMQGIAVGSTTATADFNGTLKLTGSEGGLNPVSCEGIATINVVTPGIKLTKTISLNDTCGDADDSNDMTIINGASVWYCLKVENDGGELLTVGSLTDGKLLVDETIGDIALSYDHTFMYGPFTPSVGYTNTATVRATEPLTGTKLSESSSATLTILSADLSVDKSVGPGSIVICGPDSQVDSAFCSTPTEPGGDLYDATYTISVKNNGPHEATGVVVSDTLPDDFIYDRYEPLSVTCDDTNLQDFDCGLGDMAAGASVTITVYGWIDTALEPLELPWMTIENQACANTTPPELDPDQSNNCDTAKTRLGTGATRTIGWWSTHPDGLNACIVASGDMIDLGFLTIKEEVADDEIDATVSTDPGAKGKNKSSLMTALSVGDDDSTPSSAIVMAKGMMNANVAHWGDGTKRSQIGQARVKAAKQLTGAWCNEILFGSVFGHFLGSWDDIRLIMAGQAYIDGETFINCGGACQIPQDLNAVIQSINMLGGAADAFNNSGDALDIPFPPGPANPHAPENDPADPFD